MKRQLILLTTLYITIFTFSPLVYCALQRQNSTKSIKSVDDIYETAVNQLQKHLETNLTSQEKNNLINKLVGYFAPSATKSNISLKTPQAQFIYSTVIKSYNEILTAQKNSLQKNSDKAKNFVEQALGKILFKSPVHQKTKASFKNH